MDENLRKYYDNRFSMMASDGWRDLMEDVGAMLEANNNLDGVDTEKSLHFRKGEISIMRWLLNLKEDSKRVYEQLKEEQ